MSITLHCKNMRVNGKSYPHRGTTEMYDGKMKVDHLMYFHSVSISYMCCLVQGEFVCL